MNRFPTISSALKTLLKCGLKIESVIDIGVWTGTSYLIQFFPDAVHHLLEPLDSHDAKIAANYRGIIHHLDHVAVSSEGGAAFQIGISRDGSGNTTHSFLSDTPVPVGSEHSGVGVTECKNVVRATLDAHFRDGEDLRGPYLVKIDVDGHELPIISGGQKVLAGSDLIIVEVTMATLIERSAAVQALGFQLVDIVDLCYYHNTLSQVDLVFASRDLLKRTPDLMPWSTKQFSNEAWFDLSGKL